jgi:hypothetical protein
MKFGEMTTGGSRSQARLDFTAVLLLALAGAVLRLLAARGGLWLDEAWSAKMADEVGTPLGIFLSINHDNNHHLNSLWLQGIGFGAPSWLARLPAVVTGSIAVWVAAAIAAPRGRTAMLASAALFAVSPMLVTMGSEARGYAPMTLAFLVAILLVDRWLARGADYRPQTGLALCFFIGMLSHLTMLFGIVALGGWVFLTLLRRDGFVPALSGSSRLFLPAIVATALALGIIGGAAAASATGFQFGSYVPFTLRMYLHGVIEMIGYTFGWPAKTVWWIPFAAALVILARSAGVARPAFYGLAIIAFPVTLAVLQSGNVGHPRYYLVAGIGLLLLFGEMVAAGIRAGGISRAMAGIGGVAVLAGCMVQDIDLIRNQRGDPASAVAHIRALSPGGATLMLDRDSAAAMMEVAAAQLDYPLLLQLAPCPAGRFALADRFKGEHLPAVLVKCGVTYIPIQHREAHGLSGTNWQLYERLR